MRRVLWIVLLGFMLVSCAESSNPAKAVEDYLKALVEKDRDRYAAVICAAWEADAMLEFDSFGAVEASLQEVSCAKGETDGQYTLVNCSGQIQVIYDSEDTRAIALDRMIYQLVQEDGEWRVCGYR